MQELPPALRVALAQIDPTVGDIDGNVRLIADGIERAREAGVDLVVFGEQAVPGYPAEDLYLKNHFVKANHEAIESLARHTAGISALIGFAERAEVTAKSRRDGPTPPRAYNSLALL